MKAFVTVKFTAKINFISTIFTVSCALPLPKICSSTEKSGLGVVYLLVQYLFTVFSLGFCSSLEDDSYLFFFEQYEFEFRSLHFTT
jgi:hypothetical protein